MVDTEYLRPIRQRYSKAARFLESIAEEEGVGIHHLKGMPHLLEGTILSVGDITPSLEQEARSFHTAVMRAVADRYGGTYTT
jgi:hypothetical protein